MKKSRHRRKIRTIKPPAGSVFFRKFASKPLDISWALRRIEIDSIEIDSKEDDFINNLGILSHISTHSHMVKRELETKGMKKIQSWIHDDCIVSHHRSSWNDTYIGMAHMLARRSHDSQTQCGCIITTTDHKPLGMGYNGFPAGIPDNFLPNTRPEKYPWMIHAELNAILNCTGKPEGGIAFVTGHPCLHCLMCLCQVGITHVIYDINHSITMINEQEETRVEIMKWLAAEKISVVGYDYQREK